jgi:hypothetical protein
MSEMQVEEGKRALMELTIRLFSKTTDAEKTAMLSPFGQHNYNARADDLVIRMVTGVGPTPNQWAEILFCEENPGNKRIT